MADLRGEPTMEEILASIRRIISEEPAPAARTPAARKGAARPQPPVASEEAEPPRSAEPAPETRAAGASFEAHFEAAREELEIPAPAPAEASPPPAAQDDEEILELTDVADIAPDPAILSAATASAAAERLQQFSEAVSQSGGGITLEALVREMLRPMLKQWLDANLPDIVDQVVSREIARLTGKGR